MAKSTMYAAARAAAEAEAKGPEVVVRGGLGGGPGAMAL